MEPVQEHHRVLNPWVPGKDDDSPELQDDGDPWTEFIGLADWETMRRALLDEEFAKGLSPAFANKRRRTAKLVGKLKRARHYAPPVKGGTGKQARTRRNRFSG
jgi:hypothetical protein